MHDLENSLNFGLLEDGDFAGDGSFAVRVLRVWVSGIRQKRAVGFGGELALEVCAGCFDSAGGPAHFSGFRAVHVGRQDDASARAGDSRELLQRFFGLVQQMDDIGGDDNVEALVRIRELHDITGLKTDIGKISIFSFCAPEHIDGKIRCDEAFAAPCDHAAK